MCNIKSFVNVDMLCKVEVSRQHEKILNRNLLDTMAIYLDWHSYLKENRKHGRDFFQDKGCDHGICDKVKL